MSLLKFENTGKFSGFRFEDFLELDESRWVEIIWAEITCVGILWVEIIWNVTKNVIVFQLWVTL